jgi:dihydrodipicolinate synthase/N-acetylneuraminate lyase
MGVIPNAKVRLPLAEADDDEKAQIEKALADYGITA